MASTLETLWDAWEMLSRALDGGPIVKGYALGLYAFPTGRREIIVARPTRDGRRV